MGEQVRVRPFLSWEKHATLALSFVSKLPPLLCPAGRQAAYHLMSCTNSHSKVEIIPYGS